MANTKKLEEVLANKIKTAGRQTDVSEQGNEVEEAVNKIQGDDNTKNTVEDLSLQLDSVALALQTLQMQIDSLLIRVEALEKEVLGNKSEQEVMPAEEEQK